MRVTRDEVTLLYTPEARTTEGAEKPRKSVEGYRTSNATRYSRNAANMNSSPVFANPRATLIYKRRSV